MRRDHIIIALDVGTAAEAVSLALNLAPFAGWMKIGLQLFTAEGPAAVRAVQESGAKILLDLKLHDIPNTVASAVESAAGLGVQMLTVHLMGGSEMIRAAVAAAPSSLLLVGVTVLTSATDETLHGIGIPGTASEQTVKLAELGIATGIEGLVTSGHEIAAIRKAVGRDVKLVVPGIRAGDAEIDDQKRTMTAREAIAAGADYLVIGRPITAAVDPVAAAKRLLGEIEN